MPCMSTTRNYWIFEIIYLQLKACTLIFFFRKNSHCLNVRVDVWIVLGKWIFEKLCSKSRFLCFIYFSYFAILWIERILEDHFGVSVKISEGWVVQKPISTNPGLKMTDHGFNFPVIKVTLIANVLWSLRLIDNRKYKQETIVKSSETEIKIHVNPELASIVLWTTGPRGVSLRGFSELLRKYRMNRQIPWENTLGIPP